MQSHSPKNTLLHQQHTLGSKMHSTENYQIMIQPLSRVAGITAARGYLLNTAQIHQKGCKIHTVVSVLEPRPLACK